MLADDLLKQHSIPELRLLQDRLHKEANGKKHELQSMVGSKYHDFIQSADAITIMREKSELMGEKLASFFSSSQDLVMATNELLGSDDGGKVKSSGGGASKGKFSSSVNLTDSAVWALLERCDVFRASLTVQLARLLLRLDEPAYISKIANFSLPASLESSCRSVVFLQQTVIEDARLVLLLPGLNGADKAQTLAALGLLSGLQRGDLLQRFLQGATMLLGEEEDVSDDSEDVADDTEDDDDARLSAGAASLVRTVQVLQQTILEAHLLFFKPVASDGSSQSPQLAEAVSLLRPTGLLSLYQLSFAHELIAQFKAVLSQHGSHAPWSVDDVGLDRAAFDAQELAAMGQAELKRVFDRWLAEAIRTVADKSRRVLGSMQSAALVARLQQRVFQCSTTVAPGSSHSQQDWETASLELLASARMRARLEKEREAAPDDTARDGADDPTKLLWSSALRAPFLLQVERLLRRSCQGVIMRAREQLLLALEAEGLAVDSFSLAVTVPPALATAAPSSSSSSSSSATAASSSSSSASSVPSAASSSRLFRRAEGVRARLEEDLLDLLADTVQHPTRHGTPSASAEEVSNDPQSSAALSRAFYVQCSQLLGQLMVALRTLTFSMASALELRHTLREKAPDQHDARAFSLLSSGLLLLGRFAWLLKIRGRFLDEALASHGLGADKSGISSSGAQLGTARYDLSSEDQVRSAFEIADTDGDGIVTYSEAVEAVQALTVGDTDDSLLGAGAASSVTSLTPFLSMLLTPSLTFTELSMLCAHLLSPESCRPADRLRACIEELVSAAHAKWSERVVADLGVALAAELASELGTDGNAHLRTFWKAQWVDMEEAQREQMLVPSSCSTALTNFFLGVNQRAAACLVSIDTVQVLPPVTEGSSSADASASGGRLSSLVLARLHGLAASAAVSHYAAFLSARPPEASLGVPSSRAGMLAQSRAEDCALQAVFDLQVLDAVAGRCCVPAPPELKGCQAGWRARLDPINAELVLPLVRAAAALFASKTFLLFPGVLPGAATPAAPAAEEDAVAGIFSAAQPCRFSLLPLAMATHSHTHGGGSAGERKGGQDNGNEARDVAAKGKAAKGGGDAGSGGLGKSMLAGLGSILGGAAKADP